MGSKERELLEQIGSGITAWEPKNQAEADDIIETLENLVADEFISGYHVHEESHTGRGDIDRIIIGGLTLKGGDRTQWPT